MDVRRIAPNTFVVASRSNQTAQYIVTVRRLDDGSINARCTCDWARNGGIACTHVLAALSRIAEKKKRDISFWVDYENARRQHNRILRLADDRSTVYITSRPLHKTS
jgi:uncharacterized Zn finger protein